MCLCITELSLEGFLSAALRVGLFMRFQVFLAVRALFVSVCRVFLDGNYDFYGYRGSSGLGL